MVASPAASPPEGRATWLAVVAIALVLLAGDAWIVWGGRSPGAIPGASDVSPVLFLQVGQSRTLPPGRADEGSAVACVRAGLQVQAVVPARGRSAVQHLAPVSGSGGVTIRLWHLRNDAVRAVCTD